VTTTGPEVADVAPGSSRTVTIRVDGSGSPAERPATRWRRRLIVLAIFFVAEQAMFRRTPGQLHHRAPANLGDPVLVMWILRSGWHNLLHHPRTLFDGNIFWPYKHTLAYADSLLSVAPLYALLFNITHSWTFALNLLILLLIIVNCATTYSLTRWLTGSTEAAVFAGLAFGFSGFILSQVGHAQLMVIGFLPLGFLCLLKVLDAPSVGRAIALGLVNLLIAYGALYWLALYVVGAVVIIAFHLLRTRRLPRPLVVAAAVAGAISLAALPALLPYRQVQQQYPRRATLPGLRPGDLIRPATGSYLYPGLANRVVAADDEHQLFAGFIVFGLAAGGAVVLALRSRPRPAVPRHFIAPAKPPDATSGQLRVSSTWAIVLAAAAGSALALGTSSHFPTPWSAFGAHLPGLSGIRAVSRLGVAVLLGLAVLAAVGLAAATARAPLRLRVALAAVACAVALVELSAPLPWTVLPEDPATLAVYRALDHDPPGAVVELPLADPTTDALGAAYTEPPRMVWSTLDNHPRVNGYSGYTPATYSHDAALMAALPSAPSLARLSELGVRYLILHLGTQVGGLTLTAGQAAAIVDGLGARASAARYGPNELVTLR